MQPPHKFKSDEGFSLCLGCNKWKKTVSFYHEWKLWNLCLEDYLEYWFNIDELENNYWPPNGYKRPKNKILNGKLMGATNA